MTPPIAGTGSTFGTGLPARLDQAQRDLAARRAQVDRATTWSVVLVLLVLIVAGTSLTYTYTLASEVSEPKFAVDALELVVREQAPKLRPDMEKYIVDNAPELAKTLTKTIVQHIPDFRKKLEDVVVEQVTANVTEAQLMTQQHFESFLRDNKTVIQANLEHLASSEKLSKDSLKELQDAMEKSFQGDMQSQARGMMEGLESLTKRMKRLAAANPKDLTHEETVERQLVRLARRLQLEKVDPEMFEPAPSAPQADTSLPHVGPPPGTKVVPEKRRSHKERGPGKDKGKGGGPLN